MRSTRNSLIYNSSWSPRAIALCAYAAAALFVVGCGSSPNFEANTTNQTGTGETGSLSIPVPTRVDGGGDLLVAILGVQGNPNTLGPEGWISVPGFGGFNGAICSGDGQGTACQLAVLTKIADGSETSAEFSWRPARQAAGAVLRFSNVDTNSPIGATGTGRGSSGLPTAPVITTTRDGSRVIRVTVAEMDDAKGFLTGAVALQDAPATARVNIVSFPSATTDPTNGCGPPLSECAELEEAVALAVSDSYSGGAGGSGAASWELAGGDQWLAASIEIKGPSN